MTSSEKTRKVRHSPSVVADHQAYLLDLMAELDRAAISIRLGQSVKEAGLSQAEMADLVDVSKRSIEDYVSPRNRTIPWDRLDEWAQATGRSKKWLLHGDELDEEEPASGVSNAELRAELAAIRQLVERLVDRLDPEQPQAGSSSS